MRRIRGIKQRLKESIGNRRGVHLSLITTTHNNDQDIPIKKVISTYVESRIPGLSSTDMYLISEYTFRGSNECREVKDLVLGYVDSMMDEKDYVRLAKVLSLFKYVFTAGSPQFYYEFVDGSPNNENEKEIKTGRMKHQNLVGVWKFKAIYETLVISNDKANQMAIGKIRHQIEQLIHILEDESYRNQIRAEYSSIVDEIHSPSRGRHSFELAPVGSRSLEIPSGSKRSLELYSRGKTSSELSPTVETHARLFQDRKLEKISEM